KSFGYGAAPCARRAPSFRRLTTICSWSSGIPTRSKVEGFYWVRRRRSRNDGVAGVEHEERRSCAGAHQVGDHGDGVDTIRGVRLEVLDRAAEWRRCARQREDVGRRTARVGRRHGIGAHPVETRRRRRPDQPAEKDRVAAPHGGRREATEAAAGRCWIARADEEPGGARRRQVETLLATLVERGAESDQRIARGGRVEGVEAPRKPPGSTAALLGQQQGARAAAQTEPRLLGATRLR